MLILTCLVLIIGSVRGPEDGIDPFPFTFPTLDEQGPFPFHESNENERDSLIIIYSFTILSHLFGVKHID